MFHSNLKLSNYCTSQIKGYPNFYQNLIQLWEDVSEEEPKDVSEICEEIISNCQTLFNKCFIDKGILRIRDIIKICCFLHWIQSVDPHFLLSYIIMDLPIFVIPEWATLLVDIRCPQGGS